VVGGFLQAVIGIIANTDALFFSGGYIHIILTYARKGNQPAFLQILGHFATNDISWRHPYSQRHNTISFRTGRHKFFLSSAKIFSTSAPT
jgi:hypothetical protein